MNNRSLLRLTIWVVLLTVLLRLPSLVHPQAIDDEAVYSLVGNAVAEGGHPYLDAVERKPPLLFWTYAAIIRTGGEYNWFFLHAVALAWIVTTMAGLYVLGRRLFNPITGLIAAFLYSLFQPWGPFLDLAFNGEVVMNLPIVWAWAIGLGPSRSKLRLELLIAGALLCAGFLLKQPAAIAAVPLGLYLLSPAYRRGRGLTWRGGIIQAAILTGGFFGALGGVAIILRRQGLLRETIYWTLTNHTVTHIFWQKALLHTLAFAGACAPLVLGALLSWRSRAEIWRGKEAERFALGALVVASAIGTAAGARFYPHYYIQLVPPLCLLAAPVFERLFFSADRIRFLFLTPRLVALWLVLTFLGFNASHWYGEWYRRRHTESGLYIRNHSHATDRIFVWGQAAPIYLDAQRRPACRYVVTFPLTGLIFGGIYNVNTHDRIVPGAWDNLDKDFQRHPPAYIVVTDGSRKNAQYPVADFPVLARWLEQYQPVLRSAEGTVYRRTQ